MRVIAGTARGRALVAPKGTATRPITDRVKETLFAILGERVPGARVLDLFAGSGAIGLEALSRGAVHCTFVERDPRAVAVIGENLRRTGLVREATVVRRDVSAYLANPDPSPFDLVVLDPPYADHAILAPLERLRPRLAPGAVVVVKHHWRTAIPDAPGLSPLRERRFGETTLTFLQAPGAADRTEES